MSENLLSYERMSTRTHFEIESKGNSEMAYSSENSCLLFFLLWVFATKPCQSRAPASLHTSASIIFSFSIAHSGPNGSQDKKVFNLEKVFHCDNFEKKSKKRQYIFNSFTVIGFSLMSDLYENKLSYNCVPYIIFLDPWSFNITFYSLKLRPSALSRKI